MSVELEDLRVFVVLAQELHFGRAAERLHLSQPGLTYRIRRLEASLGYEVLQRSRRAVQLTPAGRTLLEGSRGTSPAVGPIVGPNPAVPSRIRIDSIAVRGA